MFRLLFVTPELLKELVGFLLLIEKGAAVNCENKWGETPLSIAEAEGNMKVVLVLK